MFLLWFPCRRPFIIDNPDLGIQGDSCIRSSFKGNYFLFCKWQDWQDRELPVTRRPPQKYESLRISTMQWRFFDPGRKCRWLCNLHKIQAIEMSINTIVVQETVINSYEQWFSYHYYMSFQKLSMHGINYFFYYEIRSTLVIHDYIILSFSKNGISFFMYHRFSMCNFLTLKQVRVTKRSEVDRPFQP